MTQNARVKTIATIYNYYNGEVDNFEFEDSFPITNDPMILEIRRQFWYFYDDTRRHLWFEFHSRDEELFVSAWLYLLNTASSSNKIKDYLAISEKGKRCQEESLKRIMTNLYNHKEFSVYIPPISLKLIKKTAKINNLKYIFFRHLYLNRLKQKILAIMKNRKPQECFLKWNPTGHNSKDISDILPSNMINNAVLSRILPDDSCAFVLSEPYLTRAICYFVKQSNDDISIIQLINTSANLTHDKQTALISYMQSSFGNLKK